MRLAFIVPIRPVPCGRARAFLKGGRMIHTTPPRTREYERAVMLHAISAIAGARWPLGGEGPFGLRIDVYRAAAAGDADNFAKGITDGLTRARAWADDRYVTDLHVRLFVDRVRPRAIVEVRTLTD